MNDDDAPRPAPTGLAAALVAFGPEHVDPITPALAPAVPASA